MIVSTRDDGSIPSVIEKNPLGTTTTMGTDIVSLMIQSQENQQQLITAIGNLSDNRQRNNLNNNPSNDTVTTIKTKPTVEVNYFRQWNTYCHSCGV